MISGHYDEHGQPCINFTLSDMNGRERELTGIIDTGFSGQIQVPAHFLLDLVLPLGETRDVIVADGCMNWGMVKTCDIQIGKVTGHVELLALDTPHTLIGMGLLRHLKLGLLLTTEHVALMPGL